MYSFHVNILNLESEEKFLRLVKEDDELNQKLAHAFVKVFGQSMSFANFQLFSGNLDLYGSNSTNNPDTA